MQFGIPIGVSDSDFDSNINAMSIINQNRNLAGEPLVVDFTILAMAVVTMVLLMIVATIRHKIDQTAKGKEIFLAVLEAVYHELSTLGIVEATVFLVHHYYLDLNVQVERVFAEVHFTLFFVAIINALMSILLFFLASHVADNQWEKLERVDIDHYVVVRKQFDAMQEQLRAIQDYDYNEIHGNGDNNGDRDGNGDNHHGHSFCRKMWNKICTYLPHKYKYKYLLANLKAFIIINSKHRDLLVQVRFHELRVHFIESNCLDPRFRVSKYLKLCMNDVFHKLIDISTFSWLILLGCANLLYFVSGLITALDSRRSRSATGVTMSWVFFGYALSFLVISFAIAIKMKNIFYKIMENEKWVLGGGGGNVGNVGGGTMEPKSDHGYGNESEREHGDGHEHGDKDESGHGNGHGRLLSRNPSSLLFSPHRNLRNISAVRESSSLVGVSVRTKDKDKEDKDKDKEDKDISQLKYFWGNDPTLIVGIAQFMQFGYALALSILLVFNKIIITSDNPFRWDGWYYVVPVVCYALFVWVWSTIIPHYTQCTSLGELIKKEHLNRTKTTFELSLARRKRQDEIDFAESKDVNTNTGDVVQNLKDVKKNKNKNKNKKDFIKEDSNLRLFMNMIPGVNTTNRSMLAKDDSDVASNDGSLSASQKLVQLSELVKKDSKDLPNIVDPKTRLAARARGRRKRSVSDGVAAMRFFSNTSASAAEALNEDFSQTNPDKDISKTPSLQIGPERTLQLPVRPPTAERTRRKRTRAISTGVFLMQSEKSKPIISESPGGPNEIPVVNELGKVLKVDPPSAEDEIPKALVQKKFIMPITEEASADEESEDDDVSSVGNISEGVPDIVNFADLDEDVNEVTFSERLFKMYVSRGYRLTSAVFGTMVAFFMIAVRIELILLDVCFISDNQNTWNFVSRETAFWIVVVWICGFLVESVTMTIIFQSSDSYRHMTISGILDCLLAIACLVLFLKAEIDRCCNCDKTSYRYLASEKDVYQSCDEYHDCCPRFGTRLCGGVGSIEPITAIIALRLIRFSVGKRIWKIYQKIRNYICITRVPPSLDDDHDSEYRDLKEHPVEEIATQEINTIKHDLVNFKYKTGTIAELWTLAISKHPDIVEEHGLFSGLLLEAMLGIAPAPKNGVPEVSGGQLQLTDLVGPAHEPATYPSSHGKRSSLKSFSARSSSSLGENNNSDNVHNLIRPASALVRSMRRCQFKWLPLLDEWEVVDVVMTKYELLWLGSKPVRGLWDDHIENKRDEISSTLRTLKGGKGMRLCDVVVGREVFGRLPIKDIEQIKVQRFADTKNMATSQMRVKNDVESPTASHAFNVEFWADKSKASPNFEKDPDRRWAEHAQDNLMLFSPQGTLCLRFLVDLISEESKVNERVPRSNHFFDSKEGVYLWCQSISHLCGPRQLRQKLPNFGKDRDKEVLDFVEFADKKKSGVVKKMMWKK